MDADENNKDDSSEEKPGTSKGTSSENENKSSTSKENVNKDRKRNRDPDSQSVDSSWSTVELKMKDLLHCLNRKVALDGKKKQNKRRIGGRVEKRSKRKERYKRRPMPIRDRAPSVATEGSRRSDRQPPQCKYCGHRCCLQK